MTLSVCMIVKDEAERLSRCLEPIYELVDEIIVVDTGSKDNTIEIAKSFGAKVFTHPWENDFAKARNYSISYATTDWILILDADEVVNPEDMKKLKKYLENAKYEAYMVDHRDYSDNFLIQGWRPNDDYKECKATGHYITWNCRLFRNKGYTFQYAIHEGIESSVKALGGSIGKVSIPIHHYGYMEEFLKQKHERAISILFQLIQKDPKNPKPKFELARLYDNNGENKKASKQLQKVMGLNRYYPGAMLLLADTYKKMGNSKEAKRTYEDVIRSFPRDDNAYLNYGVMLSEEKKYEEALQMYNVGLQVNIKNPLLHHNRVGLLQSMGKIEEAYHASLLALHHTNILGFKQTADRLHSQLG